MGHTKYTVPEAGLKGWELAEKHYKAEIEELSAKCEEYRRYLKDVRLADFSGPLELYNELHGKKRATTN